MIEAFLVSAVLLIFGILLFGIRVFFIKNGEFPNIHIGGNKALKDKGIACATSQDRDAQKKPSTLADKANDMVNDMIQTF
ncbi:MAG: hypothetical protein RBT57_13185 [Paludibacter sp.]|jgi:hypothetical protein|nr:hypothetical protein [Paludibacter sp.]